VGHRRAEPARGIHPQAVEPRRPSGRAVPRRQPGPRPLELRAVLLHGHHRPGGLPLPEAGSGWSAMTADIELVKGHDGQWRVDYWMPKRFHGPPSLAKAKPTAKAKATAAKANGEGDEPPRRGEAACRSGSGAHGRWDAEAEPRLVDCPDRAALADRARAARDHPQLLVPEPPRGAGLPSRPRRLLEIGSALGLSLFEEPLPSGRSGPAAPPARGDARRAFRRPTSPRRAGARVPRRLLLLRDAAFELLELVRARWVRLPRFRLLLARCGSAAGSPALAAAGVLGPAAVEGTQREVLDREQPVRDRVEQRPVVETSRTVPGKRRALPPAPRGSRGRGGSSGSSSTRKFAPEADDQGERSRRALRRRARDRLLVRLPAGEEEAAEQVLGLRPRQAGRALRAVETLPALVELDLVLREVAGTTPWPSSCPPPARGTPSTVSSSVVLPEPFGPTSPTCSPRSSANVAPVSSCLSPAATAEPVGLDDRRPLRAGLRKSKPSDLLRRVSSSSSPAAVPRSASSRLICDSFACACLAFDFL
jgi:hypothetical protein